MSMTLPSSVAVITCFGLIISRHFFNVCKKIDIIYDILHFQNFMLANSNRMAGRSVDIPVINRLPHFRQRSHMSVSCFVVDNSSCYVFSILSIVFIGLVTNPSPQIMDYLAFCKLCCMYIVIFMNRLL